MSALTVEHTGCPCCDKRGLTEFLRKESRAGVSLWGVRCNECGYTYSPENKEFNEPDEAFSSFFTDYKSEREKFTIPVSEMTTSDFHFSSVVKNQKPVYSEYDMNLLSEALEKIQRVYTYNYANSKLKSSQNRLETIMNKLEYLIDENKKNT